MTIANISNSLLFPFFFLKKLSLEENLPNLFHNLQHLSLTHLYTTTMSVSWHKIYLPAIFSWLLQFKLYLLDNRQIEDKM